MISWRHVARPALVRIVLLCGLFFLAHGSSAYAQSIVVMVNDEPVTSYDVTQRQRFLAMTSGLSEKMRARLKSDETKEEFRAFMMEKQPSTKEEAQELQKQFVAKLQQQVVASASNSMRKEAIDQLVEERLMLQAARDQKIEISDDQVNQALTRMAESGGEKRTLNEFLASFTSQGVNPVTLKERIKAQTAWRELIRRVYGSRVRTLSDATATVAPSSSAGSALVDVEIVKFSAAAGGNQQAVALRLVEAEELRKAFSSCDKLGAQLKGKNGVTTQSVKKANIKDFNGDVQAALTQAKPGEMTPPVIRGDLIEVHAVCSKTVAVAPKKNQKEADAGDRVQEEFQLYSRRHLKDLKDRALLKYPKSG